MIELTIRLSDDKVERLKALSNARGMSVSGLIDELATVLLAESDAEARLQVRQERGLGKVSRGVDLLRKARGD